MANQGYVTLRSILNKILFKKGDGSSHGYMRAKAHGIDCVAELYSDAAQEVKTTKIAMTSLKTIELPKDFVALVKIGVQVGDKVRVFLRDNQIATYFDLDDCGDKTANVSASPTVDESEPSFYFANYVNNYGESKGGFFGYANGSIGEGYKINGKTIYFNSDVDTTDVYLEYVSSGFNPSEETIVPAAFERAVEAYINWKLACYDRFRGPSSADAIGWQRIYGKEFNKGKARIHSLSVEDILYASRTGYTLTTKS